MVPNSYYDREAVKNGVSRGSHRELVGGLWDDLGKLQLAYLIKNGLRNNMRLIDIGCGCLRGGVKFVEFLEPGNYYGLDISPELIDAGYNIELQRAGLQHKVPRTNFHCNADFDFSGFGKQFHMAIAQSLFTHLPMNHIRLCLNRLAYNMVRDGILFATFFECPANEDVTQPRTHEPGGVTTYTAQDPYHYLFSDLEYLCGGLPWKVEYIGDWGHPRGQKICEFTRV